MPGALVLPVRLAPSDPAAPLDLALRLDFGVCADVCVPAEARLAARIAPDAPEEGRARIEAALAARAESAAEAGVARVTCALKPDGRGFAVTAEITFAAEPSPGQVAVLEPGRPDVWIGDAMSRTEGRTVFARAPIQAAGCRRPGAGAAGAAADRPRRPPGGGHPRLRGAGLGPRSRRTARASAPALWPPRPRGRAARRW